eukprot:NODE_2738_length_1050_cov_8.319680_g2286_i0.p1 GENE.NODE_2738_length_1050_cov_8.319680_g2286_i0~~NODE_2738_length_1050_cov_8.319680_g2286_i0.p1  ORF type:complete len:303 (+),score=43.77 NODE_2738_length_1050_cov_8.319680_g2286_i0:109-1017(+)
MSCYEDARRFDFKKGSLVFPLPISLHCINGALEVDVLIIEHLEHLVRAILDVVEDTPPPFTTLFDSLRDSARDFALAVRRLVAADTSPRQALCAALDYVVSCYLNSNISVPLHSDEDAVNFVQTVLQFLEPDPQELEGAIVRMPSQYSFKHRSHVFQIHVPLRYQDEDAWVAYALEEQLQSLVCVVFDAVLTLPRAQVIGLFHLCLHMIRAYAKRSRDTFSDSTDAWALALSKSSSSVPDPADKSRFPLPFVQVIDKLAASCVQAAAETAAPISEESVFQWCLRIIRSPLPVVDPALSAHHH